MSFIDFREVSSPVAGTVTKYGSQDLLDIMQIFNGKIVANRRPRIANPWRFDTSFDMKEISAPTTPATGYQSLYVDSTTHRLTLKNSSGNNVDLGVMGMVSPMIQRTGWWTPASGTTLTTANSTGGILTNHTLTGTGAVSNTFDNTDGVLSNITSGAVSGNIAGLVSPTVGVGIGRRLFGAKAQTRAKVDTTTASKFLFGFTSATPMPTAAATQPLGAADHGVIVGFVETGTGSTNWSIWHNDGSGSVAVDNISGPVAKDATMHTIEINWSASGNVNILFDNITQTITSDLPATSSNLFFNEVVVTTAAVAKTITTEGAWIEVYD
jgi:hypothetical protein